MTEKFSALIYVVLGAAGSGRRSIVTDLIDGGLEENETAVVLLPENDAGWTAQRPGLRVVKWSMNEGHAIIPPDAIAGATHAFLISDGRANPVDQIEAFKPWLETSGGELARVITVVNCRLAEQNPPLVAWYEACIHFSDVVLLAEREGVANKWMSDFQNRFRDQFFPCLFEIVREGKVKNPPLVLEPQARRMSHLFDEPDWEVIADDDDEEGEEGRETNEEVELVAEADPYLERRAGGRRVKEIPDITKFLVQESGRADQG